jgi:glycosyltransferase involved in cell wall biosynthesis
MDKLMNKYKKLALMGFNSKRGMRYILDYYSIYLERRFDVTVIGERSYVPVAGSRFYGITVASGHLRMALNTLNPFNWFRIFRILKREKQSVCYIISAHPLNPVAILLAQLVGRINGNKVRIISHIHDVFPHKGTKNGFIIDLFQKWQIRLSDKITVYGETLRRNIILRYGLLPKDVLAVSHGVNRTGESKMEVDEYGRKYISFLGRIEHYKGIDVFLELAKCLERQDVIFFIGGMGELSPYADKLKGLANLRVENRFLSDEEMDIIMKMSYAVVLPYKDASQSGVIPIAYYNHCPVVCTNVGGLSEAVSQGETGYVFEPHDIEGMAKALDTLIDDKDLREKMGNACYDYYKKYLRWERILVSVADFLMEGSPPSTKLAMAIKCTNSVKR